MLSAAKISGRHLEYYCSYVSSGGPPGRWLGSGAPALGLGPQLCLAELRALAQGLAPDHSGRPLVRLQSNRVMGWDFCFSAPKSASLLAMLHPDERTRAAIVAAHEQAVDAALSFLEDRGGRCRRGLGGRNAPVQAGLVVAGFRHASSREGDPQLHTHCIILNLAKGADGRLGAIDSRFLFRRRMAAGAIYRAELRSRLSAMGAKWAPCDDRGLSELAGIKREVLRAFSRRRVDIEHTLEAWGAFGPGASQAATLATRATKVDVEMAELTEQWQARAASWGLSPEALAALLDGVDRREVLSEPRQDAVATRMLGPGGLTAERAAFVRDDVLRAWAAAHPQGASRDHLESLAEETLGSSQVVPLVVAGSDGEILVHGKSSASRMVRLVPVGDTGAVARTEMRYSTTGLLSLEAWLVQAACSMQGGRAGLAGREAIDAAVDGAAASGRELSGEQEAMVRHLCSSGAGVEVVVGVPGAGKSTALGVAAAAWAKSGHVVRGAALAAEAAAGLQSSAGIASCTLDSLLIELDRPGTEGLGPRSVVVCDEAAMADTRRLARLLAHVQAGGAKLVLVGDDRQMPAIEVGGAFAGLAARLGAHQLLTNHRQVEAWEAEALSAIRDGRSDEAVAAYVEHGRVVTSMDASELAGRVVEGWWSSVCSGAESAMYAYSRGEVAVLNRAARAKMSGAGRLSGAELHLPAHEAGRLAARTYQCGDEVVFLRNRRRVAGDPSGQGVRNGARASIVSVQPGSGTVLLACADGRELSLDRSYLGRYSDYGYALTIHKCQGKTLGSPARLCADARRAGEAHVYGAGQLSAEAALVAASRAADKTTLYTLATEEPTPESHGDPEPLEPNVAMAKSWSNRTAKVMAIEELEAAVRALSLSTEPRETLVTARQQLAVLAEGAGPGPQQAEQRLASALAGGAELVEAEAMAKAAPSEQRTRRPSELEVARRRREAAEAEAAVLEAEAERARGRVERAKAAQLAYGSDLVGAREELGHIDDALSLQRRARIEALCADPPAYLLRLLGPRPASDSEPGASCWRAGVGICEELRAANHTGPRGPALLGELPQDQHARARYVAGLAALGRAREQLALVSEGTARPPPGGQAEEDARRRRQVATSADAARRAREQRDYGVERL